MTDQRPQFWLGYPNMYLPTLCGPRCTLRLCTDGWYTSKTDGSYCAPTGQLGVSTTVNLANCKAQCLNTPRCGEDVLHTAQVEAVC